MQWSILQQSPTSFIFILILALILSHLVIHFAENVDTYRGSGGLGMNRLNAIIGMLPEHDLKRRDWIRIDEVKYGLGNARDVHKFFDVFGMSR